MGNIFFTSDTHLCHQKDFLYVPRGFTTIEEMNEQIVQNWNEIVQSSDTVYHLGDMVMNDTDSAINYLKRLNGNIIWVLGNHDSTSKIQQILAHCYHIKLVGNIATSYATMIKDGKWNFYLSHYPAHIGNFNDEKNKKFWCLCGHLHTQDRFIDMQDKCYHVELDAHNCYPVNLETIKADLQN